ncbi:oligosaccharide flippase family protein [bacterium]|nr:oligosaccharide flippase family protein [bacterium]
MAKSLAAKAGVVVFSRVMTTLIDLVTAIATVRLLSKTDFAMVSYLLMVYQTVKYLATLGFPDSVFYFFERIHPNVRKAFTIQTCTILAITGALAALAVIAYGYMVPFFLNEWSHEQVEAMQACFIYIAVTAIFEIPTWPVTNLLLACDRQKDAAWFEIATSALMFGCLIGPLLLGYSLSVALIGLMIYAIIRFIGSFVWLNCVLPNTLEKLPKQILSEQLRFSFYIGLSSLVGRLNKYADKFIVAAMLPAAALADYNAGAQEIPIISVIPFAVGSVLISRYVRLVLGENKRELLELWYAGIRNVTLIVVPLGILCIVLARDIIIQLFGEQYLGAVIPFQIYTLIVLHRVTSYGSILQSFGDTRGILWITVSLLVVNISLSLALTPYLGINGTALGSFLANMVSWYLALRRIGKHLQLPFYRVLPFPFYFKVLVISIACGVIVWGLRPFINPIANDFAALVSVLMYLTLFVTLGTIGRIIHHEVWHYLLNFVRIKILRID